MRSFRDLSIPTKLTLIAMATTGLVLLLASGAFVTSEITSVQRAMIQELSALADVIGTNSVSALTFNDPQAGRDTLAALRSKRSIVAARLLRPAGGTFASYTRVGDTQKQNTEAGTNWRTLVPTVQRQNEFLTNANYKQWQDQYNMWNNNRNYALDVATRLS